MTTQLDVRTSLAWPLPPTQEAHAHLTWTEWTAQQAASVTHTRRQAPASFTLDQRSVVAHLDRRTATRLTWPLPATQSSNARLSWAAWLDAQSRKPATTRPDAFEPTVETAA
ncbi:MAG TPA: hypothetical protein VHR15_04700 [Ktedonobacterales bacterium]|jgi:hypothetical protein|nr:hypothetical protein [Ktedonobacterales bacterium]